MLQSDGPNSPHGQILGKRCLVSGSDKPLKRQRTLRRNPPRAQLVKTRMTSATSHLSERDMLPASVQNKKNQIRSAGDRIHPWHHLLLKGCQLESRTCCRCLHAPPCYTMRAVTNGDGRDLGCVARFIHPLNKFPSPNATQSKKYHSDPRFRHEKVTF